MPVVSADVRGIRSVPRGKPRQLPKDGATTPCRVRRTAGSARGGSSRAAARTRSATASGLMPSCSSTSPRRRGAEAVDPDRRVDPARPAERRPRPRPRSSARRPAASPRGTSAPCALEELPARHRDDPRLTPCSASRSRAPSAVPNLGAGARRARRRGESASREHVGAAAQAGRRRRRSARSSDRHVLAREHEARPGPSSSLEDRRATPRRSRSRRPGGSRSGSGSRASRRGARPAGASGRPRRPRPSRGEDPDDVELHQRRQPDRRAHVVGEDEERRAERLARSRRAARCPLTAAPIPCSRTPQATLRPGVLGRERLARPSNSVKVEWTRSAAPPIIVGTNGAERLHRRPAGACASRSRVRPASRLGQRLAKPAFGRPAQASCHSAASSAFALAQASKLLLPLRLQRGAARDAGRTVLAYAAAGTWNCASGIPAERLLRRAHLVVAASGRSARCACPARGEP